ncbi:3'-5' exonuclease [Tranquillimonas alkanivorans]|uniref:Uncharacterized protein n=1 Tax=Tranquillimonas alkanivorans TaxID=441119 RepID=A0A1I5WPE3_9RHOB|nr:hypothetical protein [Tranquillimonas alkanivorans]SFQ21652.1 hypothetical protein SAMN04488047_15211 [Tranquillimonas alkanivorans]
MTTFAPSDYAFIDFEASSLYQGSWPIEVGLAWIEGDSIKSWSSLICPADSWSMLYWSPESARVHNIPLEWLYGAPSAERVAQDMLSVIGDRTLISDAPADQVWLSRLLETCKEAPAITVEPLADLFRFSEV